MQATQLSFNPNSPDEAERQALIEALRANLSLLSELAIRYEVELRPERPSQPPVVTRPESIYELLRAEMASLAQEQMRVLLLDRQHRVVGQRVIYQGNAYEALIRTAELFRPALLEAAPAIVVVHNHPSGRPEPSAADIELSRDLVQVGQLLGVELVDHLVIGSDGFVSLKRQGLI